ncbi:MAG: AraC family transcriptional regulator [Christensenellales bacterium]|jgi:AraC-like DNA-binding protein
MKYEISSAIIQLKKDTEYLQRVSRNEMEKKNHFISIKMPPPVPPHQMLDVVMWAYDGSIISEIPRIRDFFVLQYFYKGNVYENIDGQLILLNEGDTLLVQPGVKHCISRHGLPKNTDETCIIYFALKKELCLKSYLPHIPKNTDMLKFFINPFSLNNRGQYMIVKAKKNISLKYIINIILLEYTAMESFYERVLDGLFVTLISLLTRNCEIMEISHQQNHEIAKILSYIEGNCERVTLRQTAMEFGYHPNYFSTLLKKKTGKSFINLVQNARMEKALMLISNSNVPVDEIAQLVGYSNISYFYRVFWNKFNMMPSECRRMSLHSVP